MSPWVAKAVVVAGVVAMMAIRAPYAQKGKQPEVAKSRRGLLESGLLTLVSVAGLLPVVWVATPFLRAADYPASPVAFGVGVVAMVAGLFIFRQSHADLGSNWSPTLEVREKHELITRGIYAWVRHPMYLSIIVYSSGQLLVVPNWVVGPSWLVAFGLLVALRIRPEEQMMREEFGPAYDDYAARTKRLFPGVW